MSDKSDAKRTNDQVEREIPSVASTKKAAPHKTHGARSDKTAAQRDGGKTVPSPLAVRARADDAGFHPRGVRGQRDERPREGRRLP